MRPILTIALIMTGLIRMQAQDSASIQKKWQWNGYIKDLQTLNFNKDFRVLVPGNLLHNRINLKWSPDRHFHVGAEWRNRFFWGEEMSLTPDFIRRLRSAEELAHLDITWLSGSNYAAITQTDRLWASYQKGLWSIRMGRQRVNWGQTTTWNPNDIFNTYNFLDFDYEERPGADAVSVTRKINDFSSLQWVIAPQQSIRNSIGAVKYSFNYRGYDVQLIPGWYKGQFTMGAGWSGSIRDAGFKGEMQYYRVSATATSLFNGSLEFDYAFQKGWYVNSGLLFNSGGLLKAQDWESIRFEFSPKYLMPARWNVIASAAKSITTLFSISTAVLFSPGTNLLLFIPSIKYSLADDLDADLIAQSFFYGNEQSFEAKQHRIALRLKWNW